jgi:hypothetical protein
VNWAAATPKGSRTITNYRVYLDNANMVDVGTALSYSYGGRPSNGASHTVQVYAFDGVDQGPGLNITGPNCNDPQPPPPPPPPPTPTITASDGGLSQTQGGSCDGTCHTINFTVSNFPVGVYTWYCYEPGQYYASSDYGYTIRITSPNQTFSGTGQRYCFNTNMWTSIGFNGVKSNAVYLGSG